jgi:outer membrane protein assembly factor BamB
MQQATRVLVILAATAVMVGCGTTRKPQPAPLQSFAPAATIQVVWRAEVGRTPKFDAGVGRFSPAVSGDAVYAAGREGAVSRISLQNGRTVWRTDVGAPITAGVAVGSGASQGVSAVATEQNNIVLLSAEGKILRTIAMGGVATEAPVLLGNTVIARLSDNRVVAWDIQSGERRWVNQRSLPPLVLQAQSGIRVAAQEPELSLSGVLGPADAVVNMPGARLLWIDVSTGAVRWESQVVTPRGANEVERIADLLGAPTVHGPDVCVSAYQTQVACFAAESGRRIWGRDFVAGSPPAADNDRLYLADDQSRLFALNRKDGATVWSTDAFQLRGLGLPLVWSNALWVSDRFGFLHMLSPDKGTPLARISLDGGGISGAMKATRQGLLVQTQGGSLLLLGLGG